MKLSTLLTESFCERFSISSDAPYTVEHVDAKKLIVLERIDLIVKLKYIEHREKGLDLSFIKSVYTAHIEAWSDGQYREVGNIKKHGIDTFFEVFDKLIDNIKQNGFNNDISIVPLGKNNIILDGAHRTAIAAYFNIPLPVIKFENLEVNYDINFFKDKLLDSIYLDYLATEYSKLKNNVSFAIVWPITVANEKNAIDKIISENFKIIYKKDIYITLPELHYLIVKIYAKFDWIGKADDNYSGALNCAFDRHSSKETLVAYLFEYIDFDKIIDIKNNIRNMLNMGNHSIHITDNTDETTICTNLVFNENTINSINNGKQSSLKKQKAKNSFKRKKRNIQVKVRLCIVWFFKKTRIYNLTRKIVESILKNR